jgi:hypothetical protein
LAHLADKNLKRIDNFMTKIIQVLIFCLFLLSSSWSMTELCGVMNTAKTLKKKDSPFLVTGDIYIPTKSRLTIESGVVIFIAEGEKCNQVKQLNFNDQQMIAIKVDGSIFIKGKPEEPVIFRPQVYKPNQISWEGIYIRKKNRMTAQLEYFHVLGANQGLKIEESNFNIVNALFEFNNTGIYLGLNGNVNIVNCQFSRNLSAGIYQEKAAANIFANQFYYNSGHGIWSDSRSALKIWSNNFYGNSEAHCYHCPAGISKISKKNEANLAQDLYGNSFVDPIFENSPSEKLKQKNDPTSPTPIEQIKDTNLAKKESSAKRKSDNLGVAKASYFKIRGTGHYRLSRYSPLTHAGPEGEWFSNEDQSISDIGLHGGHPNRVGTLFPLE